MEKISVRFPVNAILSYRDEVIEKTDNKDEFLDVERAETHEKLGSAFFYNGDYAESIGPFTMAYTIMRDNKLLSKARAFFKVSLLLGIAHFRLGEISLSEKYIIPCTTIKSVDGDLQAIAFCNLAWIRLHQNRLVEANDKAMAAVEHATKVFPHTSQEFLRCIRVQLLTFMRSGEFTKANILLEDRDFTGQEKAILRAGCWAAMGMTDEAIIILREESYKIPDTYASRQYQRMQRSRSSKADIGVTAVDSTDSVMDWEQSAAKDLESDYMAGFETAAEVNERDLIMIEAQALNAAAAALRFSTGQQSLLQRFYNGLILYNLSALYFRQPLHRSKALETIDDAIAEMKAYQDLITKERMHLAKKSLKVPIEIIDVQFVERPGSMAIPYCVSTDELTSPLIMLSHFLTAKAEMELICNPLDCAAVIQSGDVFTEQTASSVNSIGQLFDKLTKKLDEISNSFTHKQVFEDDALVESPDAAGGIDFIAEVHSIEEGNEAGQIAKSSPSPVSDLLNSSRPGTSTAAPLPRRPPSSNTNSNPSSKPSSANPSGRQTAVDFNIWQAEEAGNSKKKPATPGNEEDEEEDNDAADEAVAFVPRTNFDLEATADIVDSYRALLEFAKGYTNSSYPEAASNAVAALKGRYGIQEDKNGNLLGAKKTFLRHPNQYISPVHDAVSVRSELLPVMPIVGRDDVSCWIQWAVAQSQGFGFGFMGMGSLSTTADNMPNHSTDALNKHQLEYVRGKLAHVDKKISKKFDDERKYRPGDRERILLLNAVLAKVSAQLFMRKETGLCIKKMEDLLLSIIANSDKGISPAAAASNNPKISMRTTIYDPTYAALVKRFRLDFEEWDISEDMMSTARKKIGRWMQMLKIAKDYVAEAELSGDPQLRRDSVKKIINCYMEIVQAPTQDKNKPAMKRKGSMDEDEVDEDEPPPTESALLKLSEEMIEENETEDPGWVKRFGKLRAMHFAAKLKHIVPQ